MSYVNVNSTELEHVEDYEGAGDIGVDEETFRSWSEGTGEWDGLRSVNTGIVFGGNWFAKVGEWPDLEIVNVDPRG